MPTFFDNIDTLASPEDNMHNYISNYGIEFKIPAYYV